MSHALKLVVLAAVALGLSLVRPRCAFPVEDTPSKGGPVKNVVDLPGHIEAAAQAQLCARVVGFVQTVRVDIGDRVQKGQVLAELDAPELVAELKQKEALVAQADAEVQRAQHVHKEAEANLTVGRARVEEAKAAVDIAKATAELRRLRWDRFRKLGPGTIDEQTIQEAAHDLKTAEAVLREAETKVLTATATFAAGQVKAAIAESSIKVAAAHREAVAADTQRVKAMLGYAHVIAPFDGVVTWRAVNVGDLAGPQGAKNEPLFTLTRVDVVRVVADIAEKDSARVRPGADAAIKVSALGGQEIKGKVTRTSGALDPKTQTLRVEIDLPNPEGKLLPGMSCTVRLALAHEP